MWIWLVLLYGLLKGAREICKKKALLTCSSVEVLFIYTLVGFLMVCPGAKDVFEMPSKYFIFVAIKSFVIFIAWICSFKAIKLMPISVYGILDLSRVIFATLLGVTVLGEKMELLNIIGLILVCTGLLMLKWQPSKNGKENVAPIIFVIAIISCMLNAVSGLLDKILMKNITSSQLQFWYMLFLCIFYGIYAFVSKTEVDFKRAITCKWIWLLSIMFVIADKALFIANASPDSQVTIMTLIKQAGCIVTIIAGKVIFKEKNILYKLGCAGVIITGIVVSVIR